MSLMRVDVVRRAKCEMFQDETANPRYPDCLIPCLEREDIPVLVGIPDELLEPLSVDLYFRAYSFTYAICCF